MIKKWSYSHWRSFLLWDKFWLQIKQLLMPYFYNPFNVKIVENIISKFKSKKKLHIFLVGFSSDRIKNVSPLIRLFFQIFITKHLIYGL